MPTRVGARTASADAHNSLATLVKQSGRLEEALAGFRRAIELAPEYAEAHYNLAGALVALHRLDEAEKSYRRAIELRPSDCDIHNNLGTLLELQGRVDEAMACYERALQIDPNSPGVHRNRAMLRLLLGDYEQGWPEYEWRWQMPGNPRPPCPQPPWLGEPLDGGTILLISEQGLGDTIQFVRFAPLVKQRSRARVVLLCPRAWHALLSTAPGLDALAAEDDKQEPFDRYAPLLSLPANLGTRIETIPTFDHYLSAEPARVAAWRERLSDRGACRVGIAWQGSPYFTGDYYRSIPLEHFLPLAACPGVKLFSLQKNFGSEQLAALAGQGGIVDLGPSLDAEGSAFVDTAAVMLNLDLVITSDTSICHLAGALGVPVWVVLQYKPNFRFFLERDDNPWYPSMRHFRQPRFGDWSGDFQQIAAALATFSQTNCRRS